jgi:DNA-binding XRE family transcriptional regulator
VGVLVSKANPSGGDSLPGASGSNFKVWNFEEELENNPELKAYWYSADGSVDRQSLALSHQIYRLRLVRKRLGITQVELAKRMGVSQIRVSQIENGKLESFELGTLIRYVEALGGKLSMSVELDGKSLELLNIAPDTLEVWGD